MGFPDKEKVKKMRYLLEKVEPSRVLPNEATMVDQVK